MASLSPSRSQEMVSGVSGLISRIFGAKVIAPQPPVMNPAPAPAVATEALARVETYDPWDGPAFIF